MHRSLLVAVLISLLVPVGASAATVRARVSIDEGDPVGRVVFRAAPGERNRLIVSAARDSGPEGYVFRDRGARVRAQGQCRQIDAHTARCPFTSDSATVELGDRKDRLKVTTDFVDVVGGKGDDRLIGGRRRDSMSGGPGDDVLRGGPGTDELSGDLGRDRVVGGGGADWLYDGEPDARAARDVFVGGSDRGRRGETRSGDRVDYHGRRTAVRIDLRRGVSSTEDRFVGIEGAVGGRGDDVLIGDAGDNGLDGWRGADVLRGGSGKDVLAGDSGDDRVYGEDGDDDLDGGTGEDEVEGGAGRDDVEGDMGRDRLIGGPGDDTVTSLEWRGQEVADVLDCGEGSDLASSHVAETLTAACERIRALRDGLGNNVLVATLPALDGERADFDVACEVGDNPARCEGRIELSGSQGEPLGSASFAIPPHRRQTVTVALAPGAVSELRAGMALRVQFKPAGSYDPELTRLEGYSVVLPPG